MCEKQTWAPLLLNNYDYDYDYILPKIFDYDYD